MRGFRPQLDALEKRDLLSIGFPGDGVLDLTFVSDLYTNMTAFHADVSRLVDNLFSVEPYRSRRSQFQVHTLDNTTPLGAHLVGPDSLGDRLLLLDYTTATQVIDASGIRTDFAVVVANIPHYGGSGGSPIAAITADPSDVNVLPHELGHAIGGLFDEYAYGTNATPPSPGSAVKNLDFGPAPAPRWSALVAPDEYGLGGAAYPTAYRPSITSLMRSISEPYFNAVSQELIDSAITYWAGPSPDTTPPSIAFANLTSGESIHGVLTVQDRATDNVGVIRTQLWVDGHLARNSYQAPFTLNFGTQSIALGEHLVQLRACDAAGNVGFSPTLRINLMRQANFEIVSPTPGSIVDMSMASVSVAGGDASIASYSFQLDGQPVYAFPANGQSYHPDDTNWRIGTYTVGKGAHTLTAIALNDQGQPRYQASTRIVVGVVPPPSIRLATPAAGGTLKGQVPVSVDILAGSVSQMTLLVDGKTLAIDTVAPFPFTLDTRSLKNGAHSLSVRAVDAQGRSATATRAFTVHNVVDRQKPTVTISAPTNNTRVPHGGTLTVRGVARDNVGVTSVEVLVNDQVVAQSQLARYSIAISLPSYQLGTYRLRVRAHDAAGNVGLSTVVPIRLV